jgi:hypothetical protein
MKNLKEYDKSEIAFFNNDNAQVSYKPLDGCKFTLWWEVYDGEYNGVDKFFIVHTDKDGKEIERWNAMSDSVTYIKWA